MRNPNVTLDRLRTEILDYLKASGIAVFHGVPRQMEGPLPAAAWDTHTHPDFREFVAAAQAAGVQMMTLVAREFDSELMEALVEGMQEAGVAPEECRDIHSQLKRLKGYEGAVCEIELAFDQGARVFVFERRTEWYDELLELVEQVEDAVAEAADENPLGGYYSNN
jgi:hypothetical protein